MKSTKWALCIYIVLAVLLVFDPNIYASNETTVTARTSQGIEIFMVESVLQTASPALRVNDDLADKGGNIPAPTGGYEVTNRVIIETTEPNALREILADYGSIAVHPIDGLTGFYLVTAPTIEEAITLTQVLAYDSRVKEAYLDVSRPKRLRYVPSDPNFYRQWHLKNTDYAIADANVEPAWDSGYSGVGSVIGILEGGWSISHEDLAANYNSEGSQSGGSSSHGTSCAGVAAAVANNNHGGVGAAYNAQISKQYYGSESQTAQAFLYRNDINDIKSNSWGPWDDGTITYLSSVERAAIETSIANGRGGLGEIFTWAAGNGGTGDRVEYDPYASSRYTIAIGSIGDLDYRANYNETGSSMMVVAHSSGNNRGIYTTSGSNSYTSNFGGTSSASPLGAGVIALMFHANPNLTWRDLQHVLVNTARKNDPGDSGWETNAAGHNINYNYGFGAMDAEVATSLAASWTNVDPEQTITTGVMAVNVSIPDNDINGVSRSTTISEDINIESVEVIINVQTTYVGDLTVILTAPSGTESIVAETRSDSQDDYVDYIFTSVRHWDETSAGTWTLNISDRGAQDYATWIDWTLNIYGTSGGGSLPTVSIDMIPDNPPVTVPRGGQFSFTGILTNNTGSSTATDVWVMLDVPGYGPYGPVLQINNVALGPNQVITNPGVVQEIPGFAPTGLYSYTAYCGNNPSFKEDSASFNFTVTAGAGGNSAGWAQRGWFDDQALPQTTALGGNYPNPFNAATNISFEIPVAGDVNLEVYNLRGQLVATLVDGQMSAGGHSATWDASSYSSGIYFYKLTAGDKVFAKRMTLLK